MDRPACARTWNLRVETETRYCLVETKTESRDYPDIALVMDYSDRAGIPSHPEKVGTSDPPDYLYIIVMWHQDPEFLDGQDLVFDIN